MLLRKRRDSDGRFEGEELLDMGQKRNTLPGDPSDSDPGYEVTLTPTLPYECNVYETLSKNDISDACSSADIIDCVQVCFYLFYLFLSVSICFHLFSSVFICFYLFLSVSIRFYVWLDNPLGPLVPRD